MAVDWSIFWNSIFPGFLLIVTSSIFAYIVIHRYQIRKHKKEIKDDLLQLENNISKKLTEWKTIFLELVYYYFEKYPTKKMNQHKKKTNQLLKEIESLTAYVKKQIKIKKDKDIVVSKDTEEIYENYDRIKSELIEIKLMQNMIDEDVEKLEREHIIFERKTTEIRSTVRLLRQRIRLQLKLKKEDMGKIDNLSENINEIFERTSLAIDEEDKEEIEKIEKENIKELHESFDNISEMILARKVRTRQSYRIKN